jgi:hypothetical protein
MRPAVGRSAATKIVCRFAAAQNVSCLTAARDDVDAFFYGVRHQNVVYNGQKCPLSPQIWEPV